MERSSSASTKKKILRKYQQNQIDFIIEWIEWNEKLIFSKKFLNINHFLLQNYCKL